ncbi:MAG: dihydroxyacetone kinase subunit DhaK [Bryobacteraceae bacterium]
MKKLINDPYQVTIESIEGFVAAFPKHIRRVGRQAVARVDAPISGKVGVLIGGGSGHEPLFMGYVGKGFADACPVGNIFASPSPEIVLDATRAASGGAGVLYLYGNYSGDVMNFDMAAEEAAEEGIEVKTVRVTDDVASAPKDEIERRRGIAGDFFVFKAAGARAEMGGSLEQVCAAATKANENTRSMGVALTSCTIPASGKPIFQLADDEIEIGLGIHGEPGQSRTKWIPADRVTEQLIARVVEDLPFRSGDEVAVLVNGLGATPLAEIYIVYRRAAQLLQEAGVRVYRSWVGEYSTSLEMAGASVTLLRLDDELKALVDYPADCPCFTQV